jgi:hypothetical protein
MKTDRKKVELSISEIKSFFINSWISANQLFTLILERNYANEFISNNIIQPKFDHFDYIRDKYEKDIEQYIQTTLNGECASIDYDTFRKWIAIDHTLELYYSGKKFRVAITLTCLNDIVIINDLK